MPSIGNFIRAGLVHRLDRETDGLMIIVKTERGLKHFQALFHAKSKAETLEAKEST
jgi:23S rRNA-/tRNA-specific pseudouridylate synthase